jgi:hypothetical protein
MTCLTNLTNLTSIVWPNQSDGAYVIDQSNLRLQVKVGQSVATLKERLSQGGW